MPEQGPFFEKPFPKQIGVFYQEVGIKLRSS